MAKREVVRVATTVSRRLEARLGERTDDLKSAFVSAAASAEAEWAVTRANVTLLARIEDET